MYMYSCAQYYTHSNTNYIVLEPGQKQWIVYTFVHDIVHVHVHVYIALHVYSSCRAAWALQLICWKYSDLCTSVM